MTDLAVPLYWDSNLFLAYVEQEPRRVEAIEAVRTDASRGRVRIYTAAVSVTEVAFAGIERTAGILDARVARTIAALWADPTIQVVDVTVPIALAARDLIRRSLVDGPRLKPVDAIHLAAAITVGAAAFHTFDMALHRHSDRYGFSISEP